MIFSNIFTEFLAKLGDRCVKSVELKVFGFGINSLSASCWWIYFKSISSTSNYSTPSSWSPVLNDAWLKLFIIFYLTESRTVVDAFPETCQTFTRVTVDPWKLTTEQTVSLCCSWQGLKLNGLQLVPKETSLEWHIQFYPQPGHREVTGGF